MSSGQTDKLASLFPAQMFWSSRSPFVRKAMMVVHEVGLGEHVQTVPVDVDGFTQNLELEAFNPLGQIPTLVLADKTVITQADAIIDYLDTSFGDGRLLPAEYPLRHDVLQRASIAHNMMEKAMRRVIATFKLQAFGIEEMGQPQGLDRSLNLALDWLESDVGIWGTLLDLDAGHIGIAAVLGYCDFRLAPFLAWREGRPGLAEWHASIAERPSYKATEFADPKGVFSADKGGSDRD